MNELLKIQMQRMRCGPPPRENEVNRLLSKLDFDPDGDFIVWIQSCSEAAGFISSEEYIQFWNVDDLIALNPYYDDINEAKELFFFGSDGSNLGYAFDKNNGNVVAIDFLDIGDSEPAHVAHSFLEFMSKTGMEFET